MDRTKLEERASGLAIGVVRIVAGTLWLANVNWKRPTDFGASNGSGLARWVDLGIENPVFPPFTWALEHLVRPHLTPFGWFTLLGESLLGALLILGWRTRLVGLAGAAMSVPIALTVLRVRTPAEWPWAYYLMIGVHLLLAASNAGEHLGLDGLRRRGANRTAWLSLGLFGVLAGIAGVIAAASSPFTSKAGSLVGSRAFEVKLFWFNTLGALVCVVVGVLALAAWTLRRRELALAGSALAGLGALQVLLQWRGPGDMHGGILGATGGTLCLWLLLSIGLGVTAGRRDAVAATVG